MHKKFGAARKGDRRRQLPKRNFFLAIWLVTILSILWTGSFVSRPKALPFTAEYFGYIDFKDLPINLKTFFEQVKETNNIYKAAGLTSSDISLQVIRVVNKGCDKDICPTFVNVHFQLSVNRSDYLFSVDAKEWMRFYPSHRPVAESRLGTLELKQKEKTLFILLTSIGPRFQIR